MSLQFSINKCNHVADRAEPYRKAHEFELLINFTRTIYFLLISKYRERHFIHFFRILKLKNKLIRK
jgi:hypothetical protein